MGNKEFIYVIEYMNNNDKICVYTNIFYSFIKHASNEFNIPMLHND